MTTVIGILILILFIYFIYLCCKAGFSTGMKIHKAISNQAEEYDEKQKKKKEALKKEQEKSDSEFSIDNEEVKKVYKELKKESDLKKVSDKLGITKSKVYEIKLFLEDEGLL